MGQGPLLLGGGLSELLTPNCLCDVDYYTESANDGCDQS